MKEEDMLQDAHIHLDLYSQEERDPIFANIAVAGMVAVSMNLASCRQTQQLAQKFPGFVYPAYGFHPEQPLPENPDTLLISSTGISKR